MTAQPQRLENNRGIIETFLSTWKSKSQGEGVVPKVLKDPGNEVGKYVDTGACDVLDCVKHVT